MSMNIESPFSPPPPGIFEVIVKAVQKVVQWLKDKLGGTSSVNGQSSPEDIQKLNQIFQEYRSSVEHQAEELEKTLCENVAAFAEDMNFSLQGSLPLLDKYHVRLHRLERKLNAMPKRMKNVVMDKISKVVSLDSPECHRVISMLPGTEKSKAADQLLHSALQQGQEAAVTRAEELSQELIEEYEDSVMDAIEQLTRSAERFKQEAEVLTETTDADAPMLTLARCETVQQAVLLVNALLNEEVS